MSGPKRTAPQAHAAALLLMLCASAPGLAADTSPAKPDSTTFAPYSLRTDWTLDRDALEAAGIRRPSRLAYDSDGNLLVLDTETRRVVKLDPRGRVLYEVGGYGQDETSLELPVDIAVDRDQTLLVLDRGRGALVAFDRAGRFLGQRLFQGAAAEDSRSAGARILLDRFGKLSLLSVRARDLIPVDDRLQPIRATRTLIPEDSLLTPVAVAASPQGEIWVYDATRVMLLRFAQSGRLRFTAHLGSSVPPVSLPDLAVDQAGYLYAANQAGQSVEVFSEGIVGFARTLRVLGGDRIPWRPAALAIGPHRQIAVADPDRPEIQVLTPGPRP